MTTCKGPVSVSLCFASSFISLVCVCLCVFVSLCVVGWWWGCTIGKLQKHLSKQKKAFSYIKASVVVPDFDARYSKVQGVLCVPDDEVELDRRVERTGPHVALFGGLSSQDKRQEKRRIRVSNVEQTVKMTMNKAAGPSVIILARYPHHSCLRIFNNLDFKD